ncbi:serine/threonine-protein kinase Sgk2 [Blastomyces dermatitidis ATCC 18188]|uniref:Serine/threonine-protein kinase Sgk2 n=1 Tax=Ajellomyces dermatitidis (strain ATCC 18188 / CBS 674.68) TaxID=653446 RepID=F2T2B6_AJEDA|nr:serine/threonine-protein kinase Sgk2 [Blastomyces dermatitidis ATCC 18188]
MASLSEADCEVIKNHPLDDCLDRLQKSELFVQGLRVSKLLRTYSTGRLQVHCEDHDIWNAILDLVTPIPQTGVSSAFDRTPVTHSSASHQGSEQTRQLIEARIFEEIEPARIRMYRVSLRNTLREETGQTMLRTSTCQ